MMPSSPCFYHPTTLTLIDDDQDFLDSLKLALLPNYRCRVFTDPRLAQCSLVAQHIVHQHDINRYIHTDYNSLADIAINIDVLKIHQQVLNPKRFEQSCVVILDYDMPQVDGLTVAKRLKASTTVKIIMLTGEADQNTAIQAFNRQEIDRFVLKSAPAYIWQLKQYVVELQPEYFIQYTLPISQTMQHQKNHPIYDQDFTALFQKICTKHRIVEFYLADECGSFLLLDGQGKIIWLVVRSDEDMQAFYELAQDEEMLTPLLPALEKREKIVFMRQPNHTREVKDWVIKDAIALKPGKIYYGLFDETEGYVLDKNRIKTYQRFLQGNEA